jgi:hypothetical protein
MQKLKIWLLATAAVLLAACSGGSDDTIVGGGGGGPGGGAQVGSLTLLTSSPQIPSDGTAGATITALVRNSNNNVMADVPVIFTSSSGSLVVAQPATTDANGVLTATLNTAGDPTNRGITVSAQTGNATGSVVVNVIGTSLTITGPTNLPLGSTGNYTVLLQSAGGAGIGNRPVTLTSARNNGLNPSIVTTDAQGRASFAMSATNGGNDTITASALGIATNQAVAVATDAFTFSAPAANTEVTLGSNVVVTVNWLINNVPAANQAVNFSTTRGTLSVGTVNTDASGNASITISANNAGPAVLTATNAAGTSIQRNIEFVATTPVTLDLQATPFTVATNDQSTLTAIVRDASGNLVKNQQVNFVLTDTTGGGLSVAQATTNSQGRAQTFYNASSTTSAVDGVRVDATVVGFPAVTDFVSLTVAQREVFFTIGTGNQIEEPNVAQYKQTWVIQVTDAQGNGVDLVDLTVSVLSLRYWEGIRAYVTPPGVWATRAGAEALPLAGCTDEDVNRNGVLNTGEDANGNGRIEAGNIASVSSSGASSAVVKTDANGFALVDVYYPQSYAYWVQAMLEARTAVQGTEFSERTVFLLSGTTGDFSTQNNSPPGLYSPFGTDGNCGTPPPPDGP